MNLLLKMLGLLSISLLVLTSSNVASAQVRVDMPIIVPQPFRPDVVIVPPPPPPEVEVPHFDVHIHHCQDQYDINGHYLGCF